MNRAQKRGSKRKNKPMNRTKQTESVKFLLTRDKTIEIAVNAHLQRFQWLMACALNEEFQFGPDRIQRTLKAIERQIDEWNRIRRENTFIDAKGREQFDEDLASEKLRLRAEEVSGMKLQHVCDLYIRGARS